MELGGAWNRGSGTRSLFPYELLLRLGTIFHLGPGILLVQSLAAADAG